MKKRQKVKSQEPKISNKFEFKKKISVTIKSLFIYLVLGLASIEALTILATTINCENVLTSEYINFRSTNNINSPYEPFQYVLSAIIIYLTTKLRINKAIKYGLSSFWLTILIADVYKFHLELERGIKEILFDSMISGGKSIDVDTAWIIGIIITIGLFSIKIVHIAIRQIDNTKTAEIVRTNACLAISLLFFGVGLDLLGSNENLKEAVAYFLRAIEELGEFVTIAWGVIYHSKIIER